MKTLRSVIIALTIFSLLLFGVVNSNQAAEITSMTSSVGIDYGDGTTVDIHLTTDEPINHIVWYRNGAYEKTTLHWNGVSSVSVTMSEFTGDIQGTKYEIKATVCFSDEENNTTYDTETEIFRVYKPKSISTPTDDRDLLFLDGYVQINRLMYDYDSGYMLFGYYVHANHHGQKDDVNVNVGTEYKASFPDLPHTENTVWRSHVKQLESSGSWYERSFYDSGSIGTTLDGGRQGVLYDGEAYVLLKLTEIGGAKRTDDYWLTHILECEHNNN